MYCVLSSFKAEVRGQRRPHTEANRTPCHPQYHPHPLLLEGEKERQEPLPEVSVRFPLTFGIFRTNQNCLNQFWTGNVLVEQVIQTIPPEAKCSEVWGDRRQKALSLCFCKEEEDSSRRALLRDSHPSRGSAELQGTRTLLAGSVALQISLLLSLHRR